MIHGFFDSHAHYDAQQFDPDREALLSALPGRGIAWVVTIGADLASSRDAIQLAQKYAYIYATVGIHPHEAEEAPTHYLDTLRKMAMDHSSRVVAIGEIGLDYHYDHSPREKQQQVFQEQLELATELGLPVVIHNREAHQDTLQLLRRFEGTGVVHCFSGSAEMARELVEMGFYIGFTGVVTFKNAKRALEAAKAVPTDRLLIETDCPYLAPEPYRGRRCDSSMLTQTAGALAAVKQLTPQELVDVTRENACRLYGISDSNTAM